MIIIKRQERVLFIPVCSKNIEIQSAYFHIHVEFATLANAPHRAITYRVTLRLAATVYERLSFRVYFVRIGNEAEWCRHRSVRAAVANDWLAPLISHREHYCVIPAACYRTGAVRDSERGYSEEERTSARVRARARELTN